MAKSKINISQIDRYGKGRLNAQEMHQLERETYDDAFLNEAVDGYEDFAADDHEETLADLKAQLHKRAAKPKQRSLMLWRGLPIAASVLVLLGAGYWFLTPETVKKQNIVTELKTNKKEIPVKQSFGTQIRPRENKLLADANIEPQRQKQQDKVLNNYNIVGYPPSIKYKEDTVEYIASDYKVRVNSSVDEMLKKAEGFEVDTNGSLTYNGQSVTKARLNGKDYAGGDVNKAIQSLPADIIDKIQIVDDYGDQAGRTGIRSGDPNKILNLTTSNNNTLFSIKGFLNEPVLYMPQVIYKEDTMEYVTNNYPIQNAAKIIHVLRRLPGIEVEKGEVSSQGKYIKKVIVGKKGYTGDNLLDAANSLPADILEKVQIIDDYSNQAVRGIKTPEPEKILNLVVRDIKNRRLPWAIEMRGVIVPGDTVSKPKPAIGWKKYVAHIRRILPTSTKKSNELMVFFYVAPDGKISNIKAIGSNDSEQLNDAIDAIKSGPAWLGYNEPRQIWLKIKVPKK